MPYYDIQTDILLFLEKSLKEIVLSFLPQKEVSLLPPDYIKTNTPEVFFDYIFVIEKLLNTHVIPDCYIPLYSKQIQSYLKDSFMKKKINRIVKFFETGDNKINDKSINILPKSSYRYFYDSFNSKKCRYVIDYVCDAFGIRHTHLTAPNDDCLLFYALTDKNILLLSIGTHKDIYENNNQRIIINEFPEFLNILGIKELTGIDPGTEETGEWTKQAWENGISILTVIDGKTYLPSMASFRTFSGINLEIHRIYQEIIYQINNTIIKILKTLDVNYNLFVKKAKSKLTLKYGYVYIGDRITNKEWAIYLAYFEKYRLIEMIKPNLF
jgi:hypothetical protein